MLNIRSAEKRVRQIARRTAINRARKSRVRTYIRKVEDAIKKGDLDAATAALRAAEPEIMRGAQKGIMHRNTASRTVSRLNKRVASLPA